MESSESIGNKQLTIDNKQILSGKPFSLSIVNYLLSIAYCLCLITFLAGCSVSRSSFSPDKKYSLEEVQKDYTIYRDLLEKHHPGLYWYTPKDSMDFYFDRGRQLLKESMTEPEFRKVLTFVTARIGCGHTSVRSSKSWAKYTDTARLGKFFPLNLKIWSPDNSRDNDTMVVATNLNRKDSILKRGTIITSINGYPKSFIVDTMFNYISTDGYNRTHKYQSLSNRGFFGSLYASLFGSSEKYSIGYMDSTGGAKIAIVPAYNPATDTANRTALLAILRARIREPQPSRKERKQQELNTVRLLKIDSVNHTAMMNLSSFGKGYGLRNFFRNSFRALRKNNISHLIIDVRGNGGGSISNSTLLSRFITDHRFKIGDTLYAVRKKSEYSRYIKDYFWNRLFISFLTKKRADGRYHFGYFERHYFSPKKHDHFWGKTYILTGGNSFSATTLFVSAVIKQENVTMIGEETGGGAYGNSAWLIPDVTLPETGVRFRLPLFRLVIDKNIPKNGRGVQPEIVSMPSVEAIKKNVDYKLDKAMELISKDKNAGKR